MGMLDDVRVHGRLKQGGGDNAGDRQCSEHRQGCSIPTVAPSLSLGVAGLRSRRPVGFLAFSVFPLDVALLDERGQLLQAPVHIPVAVFVSAPFAGLVIVRALA